MTPLQLAKARRDLGLSHERLGRALGLSRFTMMRYEKDGATVPRVVALAVAYLMEHRAEP